MAAKSKKAAKLHKGKKLEETKPLVKFGDIHITKPIDKPSN
jgi:hypothetical protein